jgi:hypothetical protein
MRPLHAIAASRLMRPGAGIALVAFLVASVGYPVWSGAGGKDLSQPFPCMHRHCGCRTAEQCWRGCCCFTNQQKVAWAQARDVAPPEYVVTAAKQETSRVAKASCCSTKKSGCHSARKSSSDSPLLAMIEALTCAGEIERWVALGAIDIPRAEVWQLEVPLHGTVQHFSESHSATPSGPVPPPPWC